MTVDTSIATFPISNETFLRAVFGDRWGEALVASFVGDPRKGANYTCRPAKAALPDLVAGANNYYDVALPRAGGTSHKIADFGALHAVVLDDVGVKVDLVWAEQILGPPSYLIETSPGSYHAGWIVEPLADREWVAGMLRTLRDAVGGDNLQKVSTLVRLPVGTNGKNGFATRMTRWAPAYRIRHVDWIEIEKRIGAITPLATRVSVDNSMPDPGEIEADPVLQVLRSRGMVLGQRGRGMTFGWGYDIECPWAGSHGDPRREAGYVPVAGKFKCHHGHCQGRTYGDLKAWADAAMREDSGGLEFLARLDFDDVDPAKLVVFASPITDAGWMDLWAQKTPPTWPGGILPAIEEDNIADRAERDGLDPGALGAVTMAVYSGACDKRTLLAPYAGTSWQVRPIIWSLLVQETGLRKSALMQTLQRLKDLNNEHMNRFNAAKTLWQSTPKAQGRGPAPTATAVLAEDWTVERLQVVMADNPRGLLYTRDEIAGLIGDFGRYSAGPGAAERAFFLEAYDGGPTTIARMTRTTVIDNTAMAFLGGIQQQKLAGLKGLEDDGLLSRMGIILERPTAMGIAKPGVANAQITAATIDRLLANGAFDSYRTDAAGEALIRDTEATARVLATRPDIGVGFRGFLRKMHGLHARTALVLHMVDGGQDLVIPEDTVARAWRYVRFLYQHAEVFYAGLPGSADTTAQAIGSLILTHKLDRVTAGQLRRDVAACKPLGSLKEIQDAVWLLVIGGWLAPETNWPSNKAWRVRPGIRDQFAARIAMETTRKGQIKEAMNQWGQYR